MSAQAPRSVWPWPWSRTLAVALLAAAGLSLPSVSLGLMLDDHFHAATVEGIPSPATPEDLFRFAKDEAVTREMVRRGPFPWWTYPALKLAFWRPLSSALAVLDHRLLPGAYPLHHVHSVLWYLALVALAGALLRRWVGPALAAPALLLFAIDDAHWMPVSWLANRNALVAAVPALAGVLSHIKWREDGWRAGLPLSLALYALGLSGGEAALGVFAYLLAYEVSLGPGVRKDQLKALLPAVCLCALYVVSHRLLGYGARGSSLYLDPVASPASFLWAAPGRSLTLLGAGLLSFPADLWNIAPATRPGLVLAGALGFAGFVWLARRASLRMEERERRALMGMGIGALGSLVPMLATFPANRLLLLPSLGGAAWVAALLREAWRSRARLQSKVLVGALLFLHVVCAVAGWPVNTATAGGFMERSTQALLRAPIPDEGLAARRILAVNLPDMGMGLTAMLIRWRAGHPLPRAFWPLSLAPRALTLTRVSERALELAAVGRPFVDDAFEQLIRSQRLPLREGDVVPLDGGQVVVVQVVEGFATRIRVELDVPLEEPSLLWLEWSKGALRPLALPGVGQAVALPVPLQP